jgi:hypothetical protein
MALFIRTVGIARARTKIGFANLTYNMYRLILLMAQAQLPRFWVMHSLGIAEMLGLWRDCSHCGAK